MEIENIIEELGVNFVKFKENHEAESSEIKERLDQIELKAGRPGALGHGGTNQFAESQSESVNKEFKGLIESGGKLKLKAGLATGWGGESLVDDVLGRSIQNAIQTNENLSKLCSRLTSHSNNYSHLLATGASDAATFFN